MTPKRPNLLLFMPETLRADAVLGPRESRAQTPNLNRLAEEGVSFTNCFAQNPICSPSRCSMFTGRYPHTRGQRSLLGLLKPDQRNLFRDLRDAGYRNAAFGKNDLLAQESIPLCFDEVGCRVAPSGAFEPAPHPPGSRWERTFYRGRRTQEDCHDNDWACIQSALGFLDEAHDQPFCLYLPLSFVHPPYKVEEPFFSMHDIESVPDPIPPELGGKRAYMQALHQAHGLDKLSVDDCKEIKRVYFGMTSRIDYQLGLLIDKLKARGLYDNTIVVVFSDHGDYAGDYGMVEKFLVGFEDCLLRVPLVVRGPGVDARGARACLCEMTDLYPTLLGLAGLESKHYHHGRSLSTVMSGAEDMHRDAVFAEGGHHPDETEHFHVKGLPPNTPYTPMFNLIKSDPGIAPRTLMIRTEKWKYVYSPGDRDELFDLASDPREITNLAACPQHANVGSRLRERLLRWMLDTGDVLPSARDARVWRDSR